MTTRLSGTPASHTVGPVTYPEAIEHLGRSRRFGMKLGLDVMRGIAANLGHPEGRLRFIHLAGSNGKGSTAAFCESSLRASGRRVGLFTSPHLVSVRERLQVDRQPISEDEFARGLAAVLAAAGDGDPTFFELLTGVALWWFERREVDWVVWETGLGGRLDATNIVRPAVSILTTIALEHTQYLGSTPAEIAREKAGILKFGVPVVSGVETGEAREVIVATARELDCPVHEIDRDLSPENLGLRMGMQQARIGGRDYELGLIGAHQVLNAACAVAALRLLPDPPDEDAIRRGLRDASWPGRFQIVAESPPMVLDGAHNTAAMEELIKTWREFLSSRGLPSGRAHLLFAAVVDKDIAGMTALLRPHVDRVSLVRLASERSAEPSQLAAHFPGLVCDVLESVADFHGDDTRPVLVTGSLFLVGEMLARLSGAPGDVRLNERLERLPSPS